VCSKLLDVYPQSLCQQLNTLRDYIFNAAAIAQDMFRERWPNQPRKLLRRRGASTSGFAV
jgi:hypothetical protein